MLIARASKRDASTRFVTAEITLRSAAYRMARECPRKDEALFGIAVRVVSGQEKPGPNPIRLTDAAGRILASAEEAPPWRCEKRTAPRRMKS